MSKRVAFLSAVAGLCAALAVPVVPAAAADYYGGGYDGGYGGGPPLGYHSRDDVYVDGGRAHVEHRQDLRPEDGRRGPGPVVFDERSPERGYGGPPGFAPRVARPYGGGESYGFGGYGNYRPAAVAVGPARDYGYGPEYGEGYGPGFGRPEGGCTVERARSITPAGWEKTVTHRICYRR